MRKLLIALFCLLLTGCYTQFPTKPDPGWKDVERYYSQGCYHQPVYIQTHVGLEHQGLMKTYRRVCPGDIFYTRNRFRNTRYYKNHKHEYNFRTGNWDNTPRHSRRTADPDDDLPRGSTVGRSTGDGERRESDNNNSGDDSEETVDNRNGRDNG